MEKYLVDIQIASKEIEEFLDKFGRRFDIFKSNMLYYKAILMNLAIIGEAMSRMLKIDPELSISSSRKIVNTRNYVIHGYDSLTPEILWNIVINHLPVLKTEVDELLKQFPDSRY